MSSTAPSSARISRIAFVAMAGALAVTMAGSSAWAQRSHPRSGVLVDPTPKRPVTVDPGFFDARWAVRHHQPAGPPPVSSVIYVVPFGGGYGNVVGGYGYAAGGYGGVYDTNGRPLSIGVDAGPATDAIPSYTPDLSGSPYLVLSGGTMMADMPNGERRAFPACAAQRASRDPDGRPRTVFYSGSADGVVLREGQRGRVQGSPPSGTSACYTIDSVGRVTLDY